MVMRIFHIYWNWNIPYIHSIYTYMYVHFPNKISILIKKLVWRLYCDPCCMIAWLCAGVLCGLRQQCGAGQGRATGDAHGPAQHTLPGTHTLEPHLIPCPEDINLYWVVVCQSTCELVISNLGPLELEACALPACHPM